MAFANLDPVVADWFNELLKEYEEWEKPAVLKYSQLEKAVEEIEVDYENHSGKNL